MIREPSGVRSPPWFLIGVVIITIATTALISKWIFVGSTPAPQSSATNSSTPAVLLPPAPANPPSQEQPRPPAPTPTKPLAEIFGTSTYSSGVVIVGARAASTDTVSSEASKQLNDQLYLALRKRGRDVDEFRPDVFAAGYFDQIANGNIDLLAQAGLAGKLRAALLSIVEAQCHDSTALAGTISCTVSTRIRVVGEQGRASFLRLTQIGAGSGTSQALARSVELLLEQHPEIFNGI